MKILRAYNRYGRDFDADLECEHCVAQRTITSGYDDAYYHAVVVPGMHCHICGKNRAGDKKTESISDILTNP